MNQKNPKDTAPDQESVTPEAPQTTDETVYDTPSGSFGFATENPHAYREVAEGVQARVSTPEEKQERIAVAQAEARDKN